MTVHLLRMVSSLFQQVGCYCMFLHARNVSQETILIQQETVLLFDWSWVLWHWFWVSAVKCIVCSLPSLPCECAKVCTSPVSCPSLKVRFPFWIQIHCPIRLASLFKSNHQLCMCVCVCVCVCACVWEREKFIYLDAISICIWEFSVPSSTPVCLQSLDQ